MSRAARPALALALVAAAASSAAAGQETGGGIGSLAFLGRAVIEPGLEVEGTPLGGLSGLAYDPRRDLYYAISDDPGLRAPSRFYTLEIDLDADGLAADGVRVMGVTTLTRRGRPFPERVLDGEGIARTRDDTLLVSSEGNVRRGIGPSLWEFDLAGRRLRRFYVPPRYRPNGSGTRGVRHNLAFEGLTIDPGGDAFLFAIENALEQDGPAADLERGSPSRIARVDRSSGKVLAEYLYPAEPVAAPADPEDGLMVSGLVEIQALDEDRLLALERSFSMGVGNAVRLFLVRLQGATDVRRLDALAASGRRVEPLHKELLLDLRELGFQLDNLEGMAFGPELADGRRSLVLVSDDNFNPANQRTQVLAFALGLRPPRIPDLQGRQHRSPLEGAWVWDVSGVVTAVDRGESAPGFWLQAERGDGDAATSDGLSVVTPRVPDVRVGDRVRVSGQVVEVGSPRSLPVTRLVATRFEVEATDQPLPVAVRLGAAGPRPPVARIDDDGLDAYQPESDVIDFYESVEGMRVEVGDALVVGATTPWGGIAVAPDGGRQAAARTLAGGIRHEPRQPYPALERISTRLAGERTRVDVGDRFAAPLRGVLDYDFGHFRLLASEELPPPERAGRQGERATLKRGERALTIATYNVYNLDARDVAASFERLAASIVGELGAPDVVALQEIQDDSGPEDDGTVSADATLGRLTAAIEAAGGPRYGFRYVAPGDGQDGGQPGGNIRNALLFDPARVRFIDRAGDGAAAVEATAEGPRLRTSPARLGTAHPAFGADRERGYTAARKPLVAELEFAGRRLFVVNLHLTSKRGDDPLFGSRQPPQRRSDAQRTHQARVIGELVRALLDADSCARVVVLGDLNDSEESATLRALAGSGLVNLTALLPAEERYSLNYEGVSQLLDHILVSPALLGVRPEVDIVHVNADFGYPERASDHDPVVARFDLSADGGACAAEPSAR